MKRRVQKKQVQRRLNLDSLTAIQQQLQDCLGENLQQDYPDNMEEHWSLFKTTILYSCETTLGYKSRNHQDLFDEHDTEIQHLIFNKRKTFQVWQNITCEAKRTAHSRAKAETQRRVREL